MRVTRHMMDHRVREHGLEASTAWALVRGSHNRQGRGRDPLHASIHMAKTVLGSE